VGFLRLLDAAIPMAWLDRESLLLRGFPFRRRVRLKSIVRLESDPVRHLANRSVIVRDEFGRKTEVSRLDANKFIGALSERLPKTVSGRSTGVAPPPYLETTSRRVSTGAAPFEFNIGSWLSLVYDSSTHTIRRPSSE
jgi:hypothetical protein